MSRQEPTFATAPPAARCSREYGTAGLFGLLTPQSNPTVEPELRILLPPGSAVLAARLTSPSSMLRERLIDYGERLGEFVEAFRDMGLDAVGFACTGSSYLVDSEDERRRTQAIAARAGYPVLTAAGAVKAALDVLGVSTIALVSPYPPWLTDACRAHWERHGVRVAATVQVRSEMRDAPSIYSLITPHVLKAVASFDTRGAEAIFLAGTGMPSLRAIVALEPARGVPVLSSNLCLAWALAKITGAAGPGPESRLYGGWAARLAAS